MTYPGGKEGAGVWQRIVNHMPPHEVFVEMFAGGGAVLRNKEPANDTVAFDVDREALAELETTYRGQHPDAGERVRFLCEDSLAWLRKSGGVIGPGVLIYADPPYPLSARKTDRTRYARDLTDEEHVELLERLTLTAARVMISGYRCPIYDAWLSDWTRVDYQAMTRGGVLVDESLWLNFRPPQRLHGYARVGTDYRERERIKRKRRRWLANFAALDDLEREAIFSDLLNFQQRRTE
jgi:DNA adenine methylase